MMNLVTFLTASICCLFGGVIWWRHPHHPSNQALCGLNFCLAAWAVSNWFSLQVPGVNQRFIWVKIVMAVTILIPWCFLRFALYFPHIETAWRQHLRRYLTIFWAWSMALAALSFTPFIFRSYTTAAGVPHLEPGVGIVAYGLTFLGGCGVGALLLLQAYRKYRGLVRLQSAYILLGLSLTVLTGFTSNFILVTLFQHFEYVALGPLSALFLVVTTGYAILRFRLMDIRWAVIQTAAPIAALAILVIGYSWVWSELTSSTQQLALQRLMLALGMITTSLLFPVLTQVFRQTGKYIFHHHLFEPELAYQLLAELTTRPFSTTSLSYQLSQCLCSLLNVSWCGVLLYPVGKEHRSTEQLTAAWLAEGKQPLVVYDELLEGELKQLLQEQQIMVAVPLQVPHQLIGWIGIGAKHSGNAFSVAELTFCQVIAPQIAFAAQHAHRYGKAQQFADRLKKEVQLATTELKKANTQLAQLDRLKDEFVSIASHELRTPMTAIRSYLWLCLHRSPLKLPTVIKHNLEVAYTATDRLLLLVKDLLTVSQLEAGKVLFQPQPVRISQILNQVVEEQRCLAQQKNVELQVIIQGEEYSVEGDALKIGEIFQNLISNAVKFSPLGKKVTMLAQFQQTAVEVKIIDQGQGITAQDQRQLFQKFGVIEHSYRKSAEQGTGLGLYIAQAFAKLHQGTIAVDSHLGTGTTFIFRLPKIVKQIKRIEEKQTHEYAFAH